MWNEDLAPAEEPRIDGVCAWANQRDRNRQDDKSDERVSRKRKARGDGGNGADNGGNGCDNRSKKANQQTSSANQHECSDKPSEHRRLLRIEVCDALDNECESNKPAQ